MELQGEIVERRLARHHRLAAVLRGGTTAGGSGPRPRRARAAYGNVVFGALLLAVIAVGWAQSEEQHLTPKEGVGYALGIVGGLMMLMLLIYPLRKRVRALTWLGTIPSWFRIHMLFGILGPTLILFHANFRLGSLNSAVAALSMATVVFSGVIGRYLYRRIHRGLYGRRMRVRDLAQEAAALRPAMRVLELAGPGVQAAFVSLEELAAEEPGGLIESLRRAHCLGRATRRSRRELLRAARAGLQSQGMPARERRLVLRRLAAALDEYFGAVRQAGALAVFERLFALWHVLHVPLFVMLVLTAVMHIVAVHLY